MDTARDGSQGGSGQPGWAGFSKKKRRKSAAWLALLAAVKIALASERNSSS